MDGAARRFSFLAAWTLMLGSVSVRAQVVEAPWQPVTPAMAPVQREAGDGLANSANANRQQVSTSLKPIENTGFVANPGSSPYYRQAPTLAPALPQANYGWDPNVWNRTAPSTSTTAWWDGNRWVTGAPNQTMPMPAKFPAFVSSSPNQIVIATPPVATPNYVYSPAPLPAAPSNAVPAPAIALQQPQPQAAPLPAPQASPTVQTQVVASPRPAAPFVDEAVFSAGGQSWREYDIAAYTGRFLAEDRPEHAIRRWLLSQTGGPTAWFGQETTALKISRDRVQAYQTPEMQARIANVIGRFVYYTPGRFRCRARVYNLAHVKAWRSEFQPRLISVGSNSPGRQAWLIEQVDANQFVNKYDNQHGGYLLGDQRFVVGNGQDATVTVPLDSKTFVRDVAVETNGQAGNSTSYRQRSEQIEDGVRIRLSPLIAQDASTIELDVQASTLKVAANKSVTLDAAGKPKVDVPAVSTALFDERIEVKPGRFVLISLGLGPNFDPRFRLFKKELAEIVVLLEVNPESGNTINGQPIPRPSTVAASSPVSGSPPATRPQTGRGSFPPTELTQRLF